MIIRGASIRLTVALALTSVTLFVTSAYGQSPASPPDSPRNEVAAAQGSQLSNPGEKFLPEKPRPIELEDKVAAVMADNAAVREELRKMKEQQRTLLDLVDRLQRKLEGSTVAELPRPAQPQGPAEIAETPVPSTTATKAVLPLASVTPVNAAIEPGGSRGGFSALDDGSAAAILFRTTGNRESL